MFNDILSAEASFVKTFEGINETELKNLKLLSEKIKEFSKSSRNFFNVFTDV